MRSSLIDASYSQRSSHRSSPLTAETANDSIPDIANDLSCCSNTLVVSNETVAHDNKELLQHRRSHSSTLELSTLQQQFDTIKHTRSKSFDLNLHLAVKEPDQVMSPEANDGQEGRQLKEVNSEQQEHVLIEDEVDFSAMFGRWKGATEL